jgi:hypothetical protein
VDKDGRLHVLMLHRRAEPAYEYPNVTTANFSTVGTAYYHYFRDPTTGAWSQRRIPVDAYPVGSRPKIGYDAAGNVFAAYLSYSGTSVVTPGYSSGKLVIASASKASQYTDWEVVQVNNTTFNGEPLIDQARLLSDNILSIYIQENSATTAVVGTPLHVIDYFAGNAAPMLSAVADQTLSFNTASSPIALTVSDLNTPLSSLSLSGSAANPALVPSANLVFSGTGASRSAVITPGAGVSGTTSVTFVVSDGEASGSQSFNVTVLNQSQSWRQQNFGADAGNEAIAGDDADPDGDGVPNLLERAFGGNPNASEQQQSLLPATDNTAPLLSITYRKAKAATDLVLTVQESPGLSPASWTTATGTSEVLNAADSASPVQIIRFTAPAGSATKKFLRVQVTRQ